MYRHLWLSCALACVFFSALLHSAPAGAHDPGLSFAELQITEQGIWVSLSFAIGDIESLVTMDADHDGVVSGTEFAAARPGLQALADGALEVRVDEHLLPPQVVAIKLEQGDALVFQLKFPPRPGALLRVSSPLIAKLARGHRQYVSVRDKKERASSGIISGTQPTLDFRLRRADLGRPLKR